MTHSSDTDRQVHGLLMKEVDRGWRVFVDTYTPLMVALIERAGVRDRDEAMGCTRWSANGSAPTIVRACGAGNRRKDRSAPGSQSSFATRPSTGSGSGPAGAVCWLAYALDEFPRRSFNCISGTSARRPRCEELGVPAKKPVSLADVLGALGRIHETLYPDRQRSELLSAAMRARPAISLDDDPEHGVVDVLDEGAGPDQVLAAREAAKAFEAALAALPAEDGAIIRLRYLHALSLSEIRRALHLSTLTEQRVRGILDGLRARLAPVLTARACDRADRARR